ncbi:DUF485 domain-containing protein [Brucella pituitosa]|uniref:DUF485 domain-containing protein n=1 Tax=Brucella intermedia GD04153 TaxID=2975438 RepID=A0AA42H2K9_9HYPH|nr:DUF485 domain-containing protein [Brucella intermedia]MDH0126854.1 DUF485 domain-containing protein [Brucella intermedia GD04153]RRD22397.1 DUF485 domain-containing protein [Brucellaceae bacterium VT-16-1752]
MGMYECSAAPKGDDVQALLRRKDKLAFRFFAITMVMYFGLILVASFQPELLARPVVVGGSISVGWPIGAVALIGPWLLTVIFAITSNRSDEQVSAMLRGAKQ